MQALSQTPIYVKKEGEGQLPLFLNSVAVRHFRIQINRCRFRNWNMCVQIVSPARVGKSLQYATSSDFNAFRSNTQHHWLLSSTVQLTAHYFDSDIEVRQSPFDPSNQTSSSWPLFSLPQARPEPYQILRRDDAGVLMQCQVKVRFANLHPAASF